MMYNHLLVTELMKDEQRIVRSRRRTWLTVVAAVIVILMWVGIGVGLALKF